MTDLLSFYESHKDQLPPDCQAYGDHQRVRLRAAPQLKTLRLLARLCGNNEPVMVNVLFQFLLVSMAQRVDRASRQLRSRKRKVDLQRNRRQLRNGFLELAKTGMSVEKAIETVSNSCLAGPGPSQGRANRNFNETMRTVFQACRALRPEAASSAICDEIARLLTYIGIKNTRGTNFTRQAIQNIIA